MIKIALKNILFLEKVSIIPVLKHFFIIKISENFTEINSIPVLNKFYTDIYVPEKTSKKTKQNRFPDLDFHTINILKEQKKCIVHDIAVSSAISSYELYNLMNKENINCEFYISDKYAEIFIKKGFITKVFSSDKQLIFGYFACFFACDKNIFFPLTVLLFKLLSKNKIKGNYDFKLLLFHPEMLKKIRNEEITNISYDIFETEIIEKFTFVRAMNILNLGYFNKDKIVSGLKNIIKSMKNNAVLLVGRTNAENINNASFFKNENGKLIHVKDINAGSEIKNVIENL
jgi:hypothetical protein